MIFCLPPELPALEVEDGVYEEGFSDFSAFCVAFLLVCTSFEMECNMAGGKGAMSSYIRLGGTPKE